MRLSLCVRGFVIALCVVSLCLPATLNAGTASGQIISSTGESLSGASAYLLPMGVRIQISADGEYTIPDDVSGSQLAIVHPGFHLYLTSYSASGSGSGINRVMRPDNGETFASEDALHTELEKILLQCSPKKLDEFRANTTQQSPDQNLIRTGEIIEVINSPISTSGSITLPQPEVQRSAPVQIMNPNVTEQANHIETIDNKSEGDFVTSVTVQPNPTSEVATIKFNLGAEGKVMLEIYNLESGRRVVLQDFGKHSAGENQIELNLSSLTAGTYTALIRASTCQYALTTFVKH